MTPGRVARMLPLALAACAGPRDVAVRIRPPAMGGDAGVSPDGAPAVLDEIFRDGERCVVLGAAPLDSNAAAAQVMVFRTERVVSANAPSCFGAPGTVLVPDLLTSAEYLVEMVILEPGDYVAGEPDPLRERIVSLQDLPLPGNATPGYICLSDPTRSRAWPAILRPAAAACRAAPRRPPCVLSMPYGGVCPVGSR